MDRVVERAGALDVHKEQVTATVRMPGERGGRCQQTREFKTTVRGLLGMHDWLSAHGVTIVAMEATGVYWRPVWHVLEGDFELMLCNAAHVKNVPGRKTDVGDSQWLCQLLEFGLLKASFVPPKAVRELRELTRRRKTLVRERSQEANRLHKTLQDTGIKLDCVASDILGVSGRLMLDALLAGQRDPAALAQLSKGRLRSKIPALTEAIEGCRFSAQHALLIGGILRHIDFLDAEIAGLGDAIETHLQADRACEDSERPFELAVQIACSLDGIQQRTAQMLIGEFGTDMTRFPTDAHFASWAAQCPGNHQSAGKRRSGRTRKGPKWLDGALHDAAMGAIRVKDGHFARKYRRIRARSGHNVAIGAVKHAILIALYHMLKNGEMYRLPTPNPDALRKQQERATKRLVAQLQRLGHTVTLQGAAAA
ncbi:MAG: IS110 family transposase [Actinobacteria bacterium]|nr:IS110 family transposase [Actinomycetota bacterium]MCA1698172.1 IS110 family transposase [Actinomycetota bacterium]